MEQQTQRYMLFILVAFAAFGLFWFLFGHQSNSNEFQYSCYARHGQPYSSWGEYYCIINGKHYYEGNVDSGFRPTRFYFNSEIDRVRKYG